MDDAANRNCYPVDFLGYDFFFDMNLPKDREGHGTHVASIIGKGIKSGTNNIRLMPLKIGGFELNAQGQEEFQADLFAVLCAMEYAIDQDAKVINMSLGYYAEKPNLQMWQLTQKALEKDALIVASTGNDNMNIDCCQHWPSNLVDSFDNVISVAALDKITPSGNTYPFPGQLAPFSNYGEKALIAAPGVDIWAANVGTGNGSASKKGTSMAAAIISQQAALLRVATPTASAVDIRNQILSDTYSNFKGGSIFNFEKLCTQSGRYYDYSQRSEILGLLSP